MHQETHVTFVLSCGALPPSLPCLNFNAISLPDVKLQLTCLKDQPDPPSHHRSAHLYLAFTTALYRPSLIPPFTDVNSSHLRTLHGDVKSS